MAINREPLACVFANEKYVAFAAIRLFLSNPQSLRSAFGLTFALVSPHLRIRFVFSLVDTFGQIDPS